MKKALKIIASIIAIGLICYVAFAWYVAYVVFDDPFDNKKFNKHTWLEYYNNHIPQNPRGEMFNDLIENNLKIGFSKKETINLLGKPEVITEEGVYWYNLGMWSGFGIDYDYLYIYFNNKNTVVSFKRVQH